jgi:hypothetical protein
VYTTVNLNGNANDSRIIILRRDKPAVSPNLDSLYYTTLQTITGTWQVIFNDNFRTPVDTINLTTLTDWTSVAGLSSTFVGVGQYSLAFNLTSLPQAGRDVVLDLGTMYDIAEVTMNGTKAGYTWKPPYRVYVTGLLKTGSNQLVVRVASRWNRTGIGKGLLGPVTLGVSSILTGTRHAQSGLVQKNRFSFSVRQARGKIRIMFSRKDDYCVVLRDIRGRTVGVYAIRNGSDFEIPDRTIAPGIFILSLRRGTEQHQCKVVMMR